MQINLFGKTIELTISDQNEYGIKERRKVAKQVLAFAMMRSNSATKIPLIKATRDMMIFSDTSLVFTKNWVESAFDFDDENNGTVK